MGKTFYLSLGLGVVLLVLVGNGLQRSPIGGNSQQSLGKTSSEEEKALAPIEEKQTPIEPPAVNSRTTQSRVQPSYSSEHIRFLLRGNPLHLTPWQLDSLETAYNRTYAEREKLERSLAKVEVLSPTQCFIQIPRYDQAARSMVESFYVSVNQLLGPYLEAEFRSRYAKDIEDVNLGFGKFNREILIDVMPDPVHFRIVETIREPQADGSELPTTLISRLKSENLAQYAHLKSLFPIGKTSLP